MSEWLLISLLIALALVTSVFIAYPLRRNPVLCRLLGFFVLIFASTGYYLWGGFAPWQKYIHLNNTQVIAQKMLKSVKDPQELIEKLKARLDNSPESAKGWYLLGRLYSSQNDEQNASQAFAKAYHFKPQDEQFAVNYAHSLWQLNKQQFNPAILKLFNKLLKNNPAQPDALAMLAMNAFLTNDYKNAINYWQRLLSLAPDKSEEALAIRKAIQINPGAIVLIKIISGLRVKGKINSNIKKNKHELIKNLIWRL